MQNPPREVPHAARRDLAMGHAAFAALLIGSYAFFVAMARFEPITGDGWGLSLLARNPGPMRLLAWMRSYYQHGNPRFGQLFTFLTYSYPTFHAVFTPLVLSSWSVLAVVHGTGRWPAWGSSRAVCLTLFAFAACWLSAPDIGDGFFYRPVTTNYVYSMVFVLAYFVPMRLDMRFSRWPSAAALAGFMLVTGVIVGMLNEHTGPALVLAAALCTVLELRARRYPDALWRGAATLGVLIGFLCLFFAPGQAVRYGKLGRQSVIDTILQRGFEGNLMLIAQFARNLAPLLCVVAVLFAVYAAAYPPREATQPNGAPPADGAADASYWPLVYLVVAILMFGTSLAAPKHVSRLALNPSLLVAVAAVGAVDRMWSVRAVRVLAGIGALVVHVGVIVWCLVVHAEIYRAEQERIALAREAGRGGVAVVPLLPYASGTPVSVDDTLGRDPRSRERMAKHYGLQRVDIEGRRTKHAKH